MSVCILHIKSTLQQFVFSAALPLHVQLSLSVSAHLPLSHPLPAIPFIRVPLSSTVTFISFWTWTYPHERKVHSCHSDLLLFPILRFNSLASVFFSPCPIFELITVDIDDSTPPCHTQYDFSLALPWLYPLTQPATDPLSVEQCTRRTAGFLLRGTLGKKSLKTTKDKHTHSMCLTQFCWRWNGSVHLCCKEHRLV